MSNKLGVISLVLSIGAGIGVAVAVYIATSGPGGPGDRSAEDVRALGKCAQCHTRETPGVVEQYLTSTHASAGVACIDCHRQREGLETVEHHEFEIVINPSAGTCSECHAAEYDQFNRSRHGVPAMTAVTGTEGFTEEALANARRFHPNAVDRDANSLPIFEGPGSAENGCIGCHQIGRPNPDGSVGDCTMCHGNHTTSSELARLPTTCGSCHMGPDHSQLEIWEESRHGVTAELDEDLAPTCSTCHMAGVGDNVRVTHDVTERLSVYLFPPITTERPNAALGEAAMREVCGNCHGPTQIEALYERAGTMVETTNQHVEAARERYQAMIADGCITADPWDELADYVWFEIWHHQGRTAKHGAYMGGPDYVQWHGNYEIVRAMSELTHLDEDLRREGLCANVGPAEPVEEGPQ